MAKSRLKPGFLACFSDGILFNATPALLFVLFFSCGLRLSAQEGSIPDNARLSSDSLAYERNETKPLKHISRKSNADTIWYFNPFGVNLNPGLSLPIGRFSDYAKPSFSLGFSIDVHFWKALSIEYAFLFKFGMSKSPVTVRHADSVVQCLTPQAASIGGNLHYKLYKNRNVYTQLIAGLSFEALSTNYIAKTGDDSLVTIKTIGYSLGLQNWFSCFGKQNLGLRLLYQNAFYGRDSDLISDIGGQSLTFALAYRFPWREPFYKKYYWLME